MALCAGALVLLAGPSSALALSARGHVFGFTFGGKGSGDGQLLEPAGVAVRGLTGEVFVVDQGNDRVDEFKPQVDGAGKVVGEEFVAAWGWGVKDGSEAFERCMSGCRPGIPGTRKGQLRSPEAIAVDSSTSSADRSAGDIYVGTNPTGKHPDVQKFSAGGEEALGKLGIKEEGRLEGVAVDPSGGVWVYRAEEEAGAIERFSSAVRNVLEEEGGVSPELECPKPGFAVVGDGEGFYAGYEGVNFEGGCGSESGGRLRSTVVGKLGAHGELVLGAVDPEATTGLAVEGGSRDTFVDNGSSVATFDAGGSLVQRFGGGQLQGGAGVAVDAGGDVFVVDSARDQVDVFRPAAVGAPAVDQVAAQNLPSTSAGASVRLSARIDPDGADTHYFFQYWAGSVNCAIEPGACTDVPVPPPGVDVGEGFGDVGVSAEAVGLLPATTYHYRVVAQNEVEGKINVAEGADTFGSITTLPAAGGLLADGRAWEMVSPAEKGGAGIEPITLEGGAIQASEDGSAITYLADGPLSAEAEANRSPDPTQALSTRGARGWESQDLVTPHEKGEGIEPGEAREYRLFSSDLALSLLQPPDPEPLERPPLAPEAREKTIYVRADAPIPPSSAEQWTYERAQENGSHAPGYLPLVTPLDDEAETQFGGKLKSLGATADLRHVVFESDVPLVAGANPGDLYEWQAGSPLKLVSVFPAEDGEAEGPAPTEAQLGDEDSNTRGALSTDGSRVFWMSEEREDTKSETVAPQLYMRDTVTGQNLRISAAKGVREPEAEEAEVGFQATSSDGSRVFFTDTARLTPESNQLPVLGGESNPADLYECEVTEEAGKPSCRLKDLTPAPIVGGAEVLNLLPGVSEDGSYVYFIANGVLAPGASQGRCVRRSSETPPAGASCNLYLWHEGKITFLASLSSEDSGDWGSLHGGGSITSSSAVLQRPDLADLTARVSPNGRYLAFMSQRPLTGYDNEDKTSKHEGERPDQEVFLYDAEERLLRCVSCNPDGQRPNGVLDTSQTRPGEPQEGLGLLVDRRGDWVGSYLAGSLPGWVAVDQPRLAFHQPRYLTDTGRLFFNSPDALVGQATNGKEDVYEYEPSGEGSCASPEGCVSLISSGTSEHESAFLDASSSGNDAFFITAQPLLTSDHDTNFDVYDARVCGTAGCFVAPTPPPPPCETSEGCRPAGSSQPGTQIPASASYSGPGNRAATEEVRGATVHKPLTRAQKLANALASCRKRDKPKAKARKRASCERQARAKYGPKKAATKKPPAKNPSKGKG